jgi:hypothetical protein
MDALGGRDARDAVPWRPVRWRAAAALVPVVALAALVPRLGTKDAPETAADPEVTAVAKRLEDQAQVALDALEERKAPDAARRALEQVRQQAAQAQARPQPKAQAVADLKRLEQVVREQQDARRAAGSRALERALSSLEQAQMTRGAARAARDGDADRLEQELSALSRQLSEGVAFEARESKRIAVRLREGAEALREAGHGELADKLSALADAIEKGDLEEAARIAKELAQSGDLRAVTGDAMTDEALEEARRLVQQALAGLGKPMTDAEAAGGSGPSGPGGPSGGSGAGGPGWGVGTTNEASPAGPVAAHGQQRVRQSKETSDWREAYEALYESERVDDAKGRASLVHGQVGVGDVEAVPTRTVPGPAGAPGMPSIAVPPSYAQAREEALAREEVPPGYVEPVRRYFTALEGREATP